MYTIKRLSQVFIYPLLCIFTLACFTSTAASADIIGTEALIAEQRALDTQEKLQRVLSREDVQAKLVEYGISPSEANLRVAALTNLEAQKLAHDIDNLPAGGSEVVLLLVIILILLLR